MLGGDHSKGSFSGHFAALYMAFKRSLSALSTYIGNQSNTQWGQKISEAQYEFLKRILNVSRKGRVD